MYQARVQGGGPKGPGPPPLEIEKQKKKKKKKGIRTNIKLLVENVIFSANFWAGPPLKNWKAKKKKKKKKKKKGFQILGPPSYEFLDTRLCTDIHCHVLMYIVMYWYTLSCTDVHCHVLIYIVMYWYTLYIVMLTAVLF